jgi:hypothetical protein
MKSKNELFETMKSNGYSIEQYKKDVRWLKREIKFISSKMNYWEEVPEDGMILVCFGSIDKAKEALDSYKTALEWGTEYKNTYLNK